MKKAKTQQQWSYTLIHSLQTLWYRHCIFFISSTAECSAVVFFARTKYIQSQFHSRRHCIYGVTAIRLFLAEKQLSLLLFTWMQLLATPMPAIRLAHVCQMWFLLFVELSKCDSSYRPQSLFKQHTNMTISQWLCLYSAGIQTPCRFQCEWMLLTGSFNRKMTAWKIRCWMIKWLISIY